MVSGTTTATPHIPREMVEIALRSSFGTAGADTTIDGNVTGGDGNGNGNGGNGANQDSGTVGGNGTATGGDGGNGAGTGNGGNGGAGVGGGASGGSVTTHPGAIGRKSTTEVNDSNAGTTVTMPDKSTLADAALTEAEKNNPDITEVKVVLNVEKKSNQPDKDKIDAVLQQPSVSADTIGAFFDITLDKIITNASGVQPSVSVANTSEKIEITIRIPDEMRGGSNYVVIRVHEGDGKALTTTQSGNDLTFKTDKFSTYAIAYTAAKTDEYTVTVNDSYAIESSGAGKYKENAVVTIQAGTRENYTFAGWVTTTDGVSFANKGSATTTFVMPAHAAAVTATWKEASSGSGSSSSGSAGGSGSTSTGADGNQGGTNTTPPTQAQTAQSKVPGTGDTGVSAVILVMLLAAILCLCVILQSADAELQRHFDFSRRLLPALLRGGHLHRIGVLFQYVPTQA